ncbi:MAG: amidohydrolase [Dehalococcoidia bacterium]|nr:amidohydrolase [Dehalococcoidia bacterium]
MTRFTYSADSHIVEPPEIFAELHQKFGDRAPHVVNDPDLGEFLVTPGVDDREGLGTKVPGIPVGRLGIAGGNLNSDAVQQQIRQGYAGIPQGIMNPAIRAREQEVDGVALEVLYPSLYFRVFALPDTDLINEAFRLYNEWLIDYEHRAEGRVVGLALLPMTDPQAALTELERALKLGYRGGCIPCTAPSGVPYYDPVYNPIWARAEEAGFPLGLHIFTASRFGIGGITGGDAISGYASSATQIQISLSDLICGGVAHRYPKLKFVAAEWEVGWLAHWLQRLDHAFYRSRRAAAPELNMKPTQYWRRQFYATFEDDGIGVQTRELIGVPTLMWGNDYPHHDSIWPNSSKILDEIFTGVSEADRYAMTIGNVAELYGLPVPAE